MRSFLLICATILLLGAGFFVYWLSQPRLKIQSPVDNAKPPPMKPELQKGRTIGEGAGVWMKVFDRKSGFLNYQFKAAEYTPQSGGNVKVKAPQAQFFLHAKNGDEEGRVHIEGADGDIFIPEDPDLSKLNAGASSSAPSRGRIHQVKILFFDKSDRKDPYLTIDANNISFDNDTFLFTTESYVDGANTVAPDQVPVTIRGKDYDFDGRGLTVRWNDLDEQLELLEIAHGERLVLKNPSAMSGSLPGARSGSEDAHSAMMHGLTVPLSQMLAAADKRAAGDAINLDPKARRARSDRKPSRGATTTSKSEPPLYHATFFENVRIEQSGKVLATAEQLHVHMLQGDRKPQTRPTSAATASTTEQSEMKPASSSYEEPSRVQGAMNSTGPAAAPVQRPRNVSTSPSSQPAQAPIVVTWTGKLRITPDPTVPVRPIAPGSAAIRLMGAPVVLNAEGNQAQCGEAIYFTDDDSAILRASERIRVVTLRPLDEADRAAGAVVVAQSAAYSPADHSATLTGPGHAIFPTDPRPSNRGESDPTSREAKMANARWSKWCKLHFGGDRQKATIQKVALAGDVDVQHPLLGLKSQALQLEFDEASPQSGPSPATAPTSAPSTSAGLKLVSAEGAVNCVMRNVKGAEQTLDCDRFVLRTERSEDGRLYPRQVNADGNVKAIDKSQQLNAGHIALTLKPASHSATRPAGTDGLDTSAVELEAMTAREKVKVVAANGSVATGSTLVVTSKGETSHVELSGEPSASVEDDKHNIITGPRITIDPKSGIAQVSGAGTLDSTQQAAAGPRKMHVQWTEGATLNGARNRIDVIGGVTATLPDSGGMISEAKAQNLQLILTQKAHAASSRPTHSGATRPSTQPDPLASAMQMDAFKDKEVSELVLQKDAQVRSFAAAPDGTILREFLLDAPTIRYLLSKERLIVPEPGRMLVRDHRPPEKGASKEKRDDSMNLGGSRGAIAFEWKDGFVYDKLAKQSVITGDVVVVFRPDDNAEGGVRLATDKLTADFEPVAKPAERANGGDPSSALRLKHLRADGNVQVTRSGASLSSPRLDFDPGSNLLTATGTEREPGVFSSGVDTGVTQAGEVEWNTQTWQAHFKDIRARMQQPVRPPRK